MKILQADKIRKLFGGYVNSLTDKLVKLQFGWN